MTDHVDEKKRELLRGAFRWLIGGGVAIGVGSRMAPPGEVCVGDGFCNRCGSLAACGLPQAVSAKQTIKGADDVG